MAIDRVRVAGFKSIRELSLELRPLNVLIGANGAGKSNLISLFTLLNQMVEGNLQLAVSQGGGADAFLHFGHKTTAEILIEIVVEQNGYRCRWVPTADDAFAFAEEVCWFQGEGYEKPYEVSLGRGHRESRLTEPQVAENRRVRGHVLDRLKGIRVYHFHDTSESAQVKKTAPVNDTDHLRRDAANLAPYLYAMQKVGRRKSYELIRDTVRQVAPFFDDFVLKPTADNDERIRLEWRERGSDLPLLAHQLSDGTLRFVCLATLLLQPRLPSTILIDEPELGLHPYAISVLAGLLRSAATRTQLIVSTQSVPLVDLLDPEDLLVMSREGDATGISRPDTEGLKDWLEDYSLAELWEKNVLGGRPSR